MFIISDRIKETSLTAGSGSVVLDGAYGAFQTFSAGIGNGNTTYYTIENNSRWEVGQGTYSSATNSLSRDFVFSSSQGGAKINLQGTSTIFCTLPASKAFIKDPNYSISVNNILSSGEINSSSIVVDDIQVSGASNFKGDTLVSGDLSVLGIADFDNVSGEFLTLVRPNSAGNVLHAYKDDGTKQTVALHFDANSSPLWRLGLKTNPNSQTDPPTFAYIYGSNGSVGQVSNATNYFSLADSLGFSVTHEGHLIFRASSDTGVYIDGKSALYPALTIQGAPLNVEDLQRWENYTGTVLSVIDSGGKVGILTDSPIYDLDVNGSGKLESIYLTSGIYFQDGTFQSSALVSGGGDVTQDQLDTVSGIAVYSSGVADQNASDIITVSGLIGDSDVAIFASGLAVQNEIDIATVSGLLYDDTAISGYFETRVDTADSQISAVSGWAGDYVDSQDHSAIAVSGWARDYVDSQDHSAASVSGWADSTISAGDVAVSGWAEAYVDSQDHSAASVSGWADSTMTARDSAISGWAEAYVNSQDHSAASVSGWADSTMDSRDAAVSGWASATFSSSDVSGVSFLVSGVSNEYRVGTIFIDSDGTEQLVRSSAFTNGYLTLEVANFSPSVSANGQSRYWDQPVSQWTVTVDNPTDYPTNYVSGVSPYLTSIVGSITSGVELYTTSGPSSTPAGGVDWNQTFTTDGDSPIYSTTSNLTGGSASATVSFLDKNGDTISDTATISFSWQTASNGISFANLSGKNFLESYPSTTYNLTINGMSNLANTSTTITSSQGSLSNSSDDGTITFTNPIHKNNNSGRTITATTDFTRPDTVTGTEYTVQDVSSDSSITATFTYPSFYILTSSTGVAPTRADIVDGDDFDSTNVTELGNQVKAFEQDFTIASAPKAFWFAVRSSASQPTSFQTGASAALLSDTPYTTGVVSLEPDSPAAGYVAEDYNIYGITLASTNTYIKIS